MAGEEDVQEMHREAKRWTMQLGACLRGAGDCDCTTLVVDEQAGWSSDQRPKSWGPIIPRAVYLVLKHMPPSVLV